MSSSSPDDACEHFLSKEGYCTKCGAIANDEVTF